jgi:oligopeptide transport system substrate-binding protein
MFKKSILFILTLSIMVTMLTGCGTKSNNNGSSDSSTTLSMLVGAEPRYLDPNLNTAQDAGMILDHCFEGLTMVDKTGKLAAGTAEKWDVSPDGLKYTFHLRDTAKWSDGEKVKAQDFEYSWKRLLNKDTASEYAYYLYYLKNGEDFNKGKTSEDSVGVKAIDDTTLEITLGAPTSYFLNLLTFTTYYPVRKDIIEKNKDKWTQDPKTYVGNGPFKMESWKHNSEIMLAKNDNYWGKDSVKLSKIKWVLSEDNGAALNAFETGDVQLNYRHMPAAEIPRLLKEGKAKSYPNLGTLYYEFNCTKPPFNNIKVRQAFSLAMDRSFIVEKVTLGGQKPANGFVPYGMPGETTDKDFRAEGKSLLNETPKLDEAKKLLAEAGYPDGKGFPEVEFIYNTDDVHKKVGEAVQEQLKKLGVTIKLSNMEWQTLLQKKNSKDFIMCRSGWSGDYNDAMTFMDMYMTGAGNNNAGWSNKKYDELIKKAQSTIDQKVRMPALHEAEEIIMTELPIMPLYYYTDTILIDPKIKDMYISPLGHIFLRDAYLEK